MHKLTMINVAGALGLAALLYGSPINPTLAGDAQMSQHERDLAVFRLADAASLQPRHEHDLAVFRVADKQSMQSLDDTMLVASTHF